jgi:hypothetical protein
MNNSDKTPHFRSYLYTSFARDYNQEQTDCFMEKFDRMCSVSGPEAAFCVTLEAFGNENTQKAHQTVTRWIQNQLEQQIAKHPGIAKEHPLESLRRTIRKYNDTVQILAGVTVEAGGKLHTLTQDELDNRVKINSMPHCMKKLETLTANASVNHPNPKTRAAKSLSLEIRYF